MTRAFKFTLRVKGCKQEFAAGMGAGVLLTQEVVYKTAPEDSNPMFLATVADHADEILHEHVVVEIEEITPPRSAVDRLADLARTKVTDGL